MSKAAGRMMYRSLIFFTMLLAVASACSDRHASERDLVQQDAPDTDQALAAVLGERKKYCYRNEWNAGNDDTLPDVLELTANIDGQQVDGTYNWLPAYKDQRRGNFDGEINGSDISASYRFRQEGQEGSAAISIALYDDRAVVQGGPAELGLAATIGRINCQ